MQEARDVVALLRLSPHPEGGWFRETWRAAAAPGFLDRYLNGRPGALDDMQEALADEVRISLQVVES